MKTNYWLKNDKAKHPYQKYLKITKEEAEKYTLLETKKSYLFIDKIYKNHLTN